MAHAASAHARGHQAESWVAAQLEADGWTILDRNWRGARGELDLVVERAGALRFVEVKARQPHDPSALDAIDGAKQARLISAANAWLAAHDRPDEACFLVVAVTCDPAAWTAEWWDDPFDGG